MATGHRSFNRRARSLSDQDVDALAARLKSTSDPLPPAVRTSARADDRTVGSRWTLVNVAPADRAALLTPTALESAQGYRHNIENYIGEARVPLGIAGPLRINGLSGRRDFYVPLATTEAALVASFNRGMQAASKAGGCAAWVMSEGVSRAPCFLLRTTADAGKFARWLATQVDAFRRRTSATTRHGRLTDLRIAIEGNHVYAIFDFTTGDAAGQNMVTLATDAICRDIERRSPARIERWFLEANMSGDKKASALSFLSVRGRKVCAEVVVPGAVLRDVLKASAETMSEYWRVSALGGVMSGTLGVHGHIANGLSALFIACGQDPACVAESAVGITRMEPTRTGELYASVTLPSLTVGTVGGGTGLPTARACLNILGLSGDGNANAFAEVCAGVVLAGELSITAALCSGEFARAHERRARGKHAKPSRGGP